MSKKEQLWSDLTRRNQRLLDDPHFTATGLRKFFDRVYDDGFAAGYSAAREHSSMNTGTDLFSQFFGATK
jgi:hypothetical protein